MSHDAAEPDQMHPLVRLVNLVDQTLAADAVLGSGRANLDSLRFARSQLSTAAQGVTAAGELLVLARRRRYPALAHP